LATDRRARWSDRASQRPASGPPASNWSKVEHDVLKMLYESIIDAPIRQRRGEYNMPDWLAERLVRHVFINRL
jgi:hypothetical protein